MSGPVVSCGWLAERLGGPGIRVVDTRWFLGEPGEGRRRYEESRIPGAVYMDADEDLAASEGPGRHPLPGPEAFAEALSRRGIGSRHHVTAYDQGPGWVAARLWWMLRDAGHERVSVLDGGFARWAGSGLPVESGPAPPAAPAVFEARSGVLPTIDRDSLRSRLGAVSVIDARPADRYRGEGGSVDPVPGHIPTSISVPTDGNLREDGTFKTPEELAARFAGLGLDPSSPAVSSCGSGVSACHNILALHLACFPEAVLYPGSWSDWSAAGFPAALGPQPGAVPD